MFFLFLFLFFFTDARDKHLWAVDKDGNAQVLAQLAHGAEALLVVGSCAAHVDLDLGLDEAVAVLRKMEE